MVRTLLSLTALLVAGAMLMAADQKNVQKGATADPSVVVVDPMDLRQPVPNPERELTLKYDGKTVRFTGHLLPDVVVDKKSKATAYKLQKEVKSASTQTKGNKSASGQKKAKPETVTVTVYFQTQDKRLQDTKSKINLTVEGKGEITHDGSLVVHNARIAEFEKR